MPKSIPSRYRNVDRPAGLVLVFTLNETAFLRIAKMMLKDEYKRRSTIVPIPSDFMLQDKIVDNIYIKTINVFNFSLHNEKEMEQNTIQYQ
ncbi:hypothetical protein COCOBI_pt-0900 (chloroplast) [Coccomyxa sp. Obi]|nr:hypothetical protein COCOBI_pt-0900 [Coccomyxa sp. Obi]